MSVLSKVLGANWRCSECGKEFYRNRRQCNNCGSTVLNRVH